MNYLQTASSLKSTERRGSMQVKKRGAPAWLSLAKDVYYALKDYYGRLPRGAWNEVASWAAKYVKYGGLLGGVLGHM